MIENSCGKGPSSASAYGANDNGESEEVVTKHEDLGDFRPSDLDLPVCAGEECDAVLPYGAPVVGWVIYHHEGGVIEYVCPSCHAREPGDGSCSARWDGDR